MNPSEQGRSLLRRWKDTKPANFYDDDEYLRVLLKMLMGPDRLANVEPALRQAGADSAGPVNDGCFLLDQPDCLPRVEHWNEIGERTQEIRFHPTYHEIGRLVWKSGILSVLGDPGNITLHSAISYLFAMNGETPHLCSVACTAGLIKATQRRGSEHMRRAYLPRLLEADYDRRLHGAQFLTEVQGGSDVGSNACVARRVPNQPEAWHISGEKWFCSNVSADLYAVSARPEGAPTGTAGLGLFVVPRRLADGRSNGTFIRKLKNKLGTRSLPTAELDFCDALGHQLGDLNEGFKLLMGVIINTSRLGVGVTSAGIMRRAYIDAARYARIRVAFGHPLIEFPAIRGLLAEMRALTIAALTFTLFVAKLEDDLTVAGVLPEDDPLFRSAVNVNKYISSTDAALVVHHGIEILGGNGTIEDFSSLPRLYREMAVHESWEGSHNTLMAQILRDSMRSKMHEAPLAKARDLLLDVRRPVLLETRDRALALLDDTRTRLTRLLDGDSQLAALHVRAVVYKLARAFQATLILHYANRDSLANCVDLLAATARFVLNKGISLGYEPMDDPSYPDLLKQLAGH